MHSCKCFLIYEFKIEPEFKISTKMRKEKRITNTDSRFYCLNPSNSNFFEDKFCISSNLINLIKEDYIK